MPNNYILLDRIELNASTTSVTFDNIPQTGYTDLKIVMSMRDDFASVSVNAGVKLNGSTANFSGRTLFGTGSAANSSTTTNSFFFTVGTSGTANTFSSSEMYIPNYTSSNFKSISVESAAESNTTTVYSQMVAGLWSNTAAITSVSIYPLNATNFVANSTFSLYGLAAVGTTPAIAPKADGGNVIGTDGTYWYHAFLSNGTFTPQVNLTADVLTIAGGAGGGSRGGGGGGAGGLLYSASSSLTNAIAYAVAIGAGGAAGTSSGGSAGTAGGNSTFSGSGFTTLTAIGGGTGAGEGALGGNGGSGGGSGSGYSGGSTGTGTSGQGTNGGASGGTFNGGSGGGGASVAGSASSLTNAGSGGNGSSAYSAWGLATLTGQNVSSTYYYAGGGGGGTQYLTGGNGGGYGGGGAGSANASSTGSAATINTGGGGGGGGANAGVGYAGAAGGSGIVIIRYTVA